MNKETKHSVDFITQKVGREAGFSVPTNYFDGIEDTILATVSEKTLPKKASFTMPKGYFENLEDEILAKVVSEQKKPKEVKVISLQDRFRRFIPYASVASVLLIVSAYFFTNYNTTVTLDDITVAEIENWYDNGYGNTNNTELAMVLETGDLAEDASSNLTLSDENLEEYFNTTNNDVLFNEIQ